MSRPIFEQMCRDYVEAGKTWPADVTAACTMTPAGDTLVRELDDQLPLAELTSPAY